MVDLFFAPSHGKVCLDPRWSVAHRPHGGYLLALMAEAVTAATGRSHPITTSVVFLEAPEVGEVDVAVDVLRAGRSLTQARCRLSQDGVRCAEALITAGTLAAAAAPQWTDGEPATMPSFADCLQAPAVNRRFETPLWRTLDVRLDPATSGWARREPSGDPEARGWVDFRDEILPPTSALLIALDALPAVTLELGSRGWVPTVELSAYIRTLPAPGPLRARQRARLVQGGFVDETCELWDKRGRLVAHSVQLAGVRFPETT